MKFPLAVIKFKIGDQEHELDLKDTFMIVLWFTLVIFAYMIGQYDSLQYMNYYLHYCGQNAPITLNYTSLAIP
jgi:hypothetical protein